MCSDEFSLKHALHYRIGLFELQSGHLYRASWWWSGESVIKLLSKRDFRRYPESTISSSEEIVCPVFVATRRNSLPAASAHTTNKRKILHFGRNRRSTAAAPFIAPHRTCPSRVSRYFAAQNNAWQEFCNHCPQHEGLTVISFQQVSLGHQALASALRQCVLHISLWVGILGEQYISPLNEWMNEWTNERIGRI